MHVCVIGDMGNPLKNIISVATERPKPAPSCHNNKLQGKASQETESRATSGRLSELVKRRFGAKR